MKLLNQLDAAILIGQNSYKQQAEIYNYSHGYRETKIKAAELPEIRWVIVMVVLSSCTVHTSQRDSPILIPARIATTLPVRILGTIRAGDGYGASTLD